MDYQTILVTVKNRIATVTLNRPEYSNAFARESYVEIANAMKDLGSAGMWVPLSSPGREGTSPQEGISNVLRHS